MAVVLLSGGKQMRRYVLWIGVLTVIVLLARPGIWETISNLYNQTLAPETAQGSSYQWRYALYDQAFLHLNHDFWRALWGYGPESFFFLGWKGMFQGQIVPFESCDSSVAQLMIETGYVGFLLAVSVFLIAGYKALRSSLKIPKPENLPCVVLFVNICAFLFLMTNVAILGWGQQSYMAWIVVAMAMIYPGLVEKESVVEEEPNGESRRREAFRRGVARNGLEPGREKFMIKRRRFAAVVSQEAATPRRMTQETFSNLFGPKISPWKGNLANG